MRRIEKLETESTAESGKVLLIGWSGDPWRATAKGEALHREPSEMAEAFTARASAHFKPTGGQWLAVWLATR